LSIGIIYNNKKRCERENGVINVIPVMLGPLVFFVH